MQVTLLDMCLAQEWPEKCPSYLGEIVLCELWRRAQGQGGDGGVVTCRGPKGRGGVLCWMLVPSLSPPSWNKFLPPFRAGPQLTIFGISTKVSLTHSTNSRGTLKSAGIHSSSLGSGPQKSPGPPSKELWVLGNELAGMRGSE